MLLLSPLKETLARSTIVPEFPENIYLKGFEKYESLLEALVNDVDYPVLREPSEDSSHATSQAKLRLCVDVEEADTFISTIW